MVHLHTHCKTQLVATFFPFSKVLMQLQSSSCRIDLALSFWPHFLLKTPRLFRAFVDLSGFGFLGWRVACGVQFSTPNHKCVWKRDQQSLPPRSWCIKPSRKFSSQGCCRMVFVRQPRNRFGFGVGLRDFSRLGIGSMARLFCRFVSVFDLRRLQSVWFGLRRFRLR